MTAARDRVSPPSAEWLTRAAVRAADAEWSLLLRAASRTLPVIGGIAVLLDSAPRSHHHNRLLCHGAVDAATVTAEAERVLAERPFRRAMLRGDAVAALPGLVARGGESEALLIMAAKPREQPDVGAALVATASQIRAFQDATWRAALPESDEETIRQLTERYEAEESVVAIARLAVRQGDEVVGAALLKVEGATAMFDALEVSPASRGRGLGDDLLALAFQTSFERGCDLLVLSALADDWPAGWYTRRGFGVVDRQYDCAWEPGSTV
jgi:ribosomal protein S18 acetylase RimI-like enzyme